MGKRGTKPSEWDSLSAMTKRSYYYAGDYRVPEGWEPPAGKRCPKAETLEWMVREKKRIEERLKILNFKINIMSAPPQNIIKEYDFEQK